MDYNLMMFIGPLMNIFVLDRMVRVFFDKRRTRFPVFALSFLFYFVLINVTVRLAIPWAPTVVWVASHFVVSLNYEGTWKKRIVASILLSAIGMILDLAVMRLFGFYFIVFFDGYAPHNFLSMTIATLAIFITALGLQRLRNLKKDAISSPRVLASLFIIPLLSMILASMLAIYADLPPFAASLASAIIFGINLIVFYLHDRLSAAHARNLEAALHEREKDYYLAQIRTMQESADQVKAIRHDMKNHLTTINAYAMENKGAEVAAYINALHSDIGETALHSNTGNIAFDSIINFKLENAKQENIRTEISIALPKTLDIETSDVTAILGNLLDNALEAVARVREKKLAIDIEYKRGALFIQVKNTFDGEVRYAGEGEGRRIATRKESAGHGLGLKNIARATEKYNGYIDITHDAQTFTVVVFLYIGG